MLNRIYSDLPTFRSVKFHSGLNIILADKTAIASKKKTRNGAGKSSFVEIINALLGSDIKKNNVLKSDELIHNQFGMDVSFGDINLEIERNGSKPNKILIKRAPNQLFQFSDPDERFISLEIWRAFLAKYEFGLSEAVSEVKNGPSYRALQAYFSRSPQGFSSPDKTFPMQSTCSSQVSVSYLLQLNWSIAANFEEIRQKEKIIKALKEASNDGALRQIMGSASTIRTDIHLKTSRYDSLKKTLADFRILPEYEEKEKRLAQITRELSGLSAEDTTDKEWLSQLEKTLEDEKYPTHEKVDKLFAEASFELPELVKKRFEEVSAFHDSIISNRREHLKREVEDIRGRIEDRLAKKAYLDNERSEILNMLQKYGALDQYASLQSELSKLEAQLELLKRKLEVTENLDFETSQLKISRENFLNGMRINYSERSKVIGEAVVAFEEISKALYDESGRFSIVPTKNGPKFEFDIPGKKSTGKQKMQIFCFDMALMKLWAKEKQRPDMLIHDSIIFDGVDERQIAQALMVGDRMSKQYNFQYIVTINSDDYSKAKSFPGFNIGDDKIAMTINDTPDGGLFGMRFS